MKTNGGSVAAAIDDLVAAPFQTVVRRAAARGYPLPAILRDAALAVWVAAALAVALLIKGGDTAYAAFYFILTLAVVPLEYRLVVARARVAEEEITPQVHALLESDALRRRADLLWFRLAALFALFLLGGRMEGPGDLGAYLLLLVFVARAYFERCLPAARTQA